MYPRLFSILVLLSIGTHVCFAEFTSTQRAYMYSIFARWNVSILASQDEEIRASSLQSLIERLYDWEQERSPTYGPEAREGIREVYKFLCISLQEYSGITCVDEIYTPNPIYAMSVNPDHGKQLFLGLVNQFRLDQRRSILRSNTILMSNAQKYADLLCEHHHFGHVGPDGSTTQTRADGSEYAYRIVGENLARGHDNAESTLMQFWISIHHRVTMLRSDVGEIGVGYCNSTWVVLFGASE